MNATSLAMYGIADADLDANACADTPQDTPASPVPLALNAEERAACAVQARLLEAIDLVATWGLVASVMALLLLLLRPGASLACAWLLGLALVAGIAERVLVLRLRLDAGLFADLADQYIASLPALDAALARTGLRAEEAQARALDQRLLGTGRLLRGYLLTLALQTALLIGAWLL